MSPEQFKNTVSAKTRSRKCRSSWRGAARLAPPTEALKEAIVLSVTPVAAPRMTASDKWNKRPCVVQYHAYKDQVKRQLAGVHLPDAFRVVFVLPMPVSWSKKKRHAMNGQPHKSRPDGDNLTKALCDAQGFEDARHWSVDYSTIWGVDGFIYIEPVNDYTLPPAVSSRIESRLD